MLLLCFLDNLAWFIFISFKMLSFSTSIISIPTLSTKALLCNFRNIFNFPLPVKKFPLIQAFISNCTISPNSSLSGVIIENPMKPISTNSHFYKILESLLSNFKVTRPFIKYLPYFAYHAYNRTF